jgi:hypothetical protein
MLELIERLRGRREAKAQTDREKYVELVHKAAANGGDLAADKDTTAIESLAEKLGFGLEQIAEHITAAGQIVPLRAQAITFEEHRMANKTGKVELAAFDAETKLIVKQRADARTAKENKNHLALAGMTAASAARNELEQIQRKFPFLFAPDEDGAWDREQKRNTKHLALRRAFVEDAADFVFVTDLLSPVARENFGHLNFVLADGQSAEEFEEATSILEGCREGATDASTFDQRLEALVAAGIPADRDGKRKRAEQGDLKTTLTYETGSADAIAQATPMWRIRYACACARVAQQLEKLGKSDVPQYIAARLGD